MRPCNVLQQQNQRCTKSRPSQSWESHNQKRLISIFAISTYDTDYILVKENLAFAAAYEWVLAGHLVNGLPETPTTKDGPATTFEKDPMIQHMIDQTRGKVSDREIFGLLVVSGWPPSEVVQAAYNNKFLPAIQKCFRE